MASAVARPPLKELGADPVSGRPIVVKEGRYGPYVTDGETNATLSARAGDTPDNVTPERAASLLQARRDAGPAQPRRGARAAGGATAKAKAPAKKAAASKRAAPAKKAAGKPAKAARARKAP